jgi:hypothetical protein
MAKRRSRKRSRENKFEPGRSPRQHAGAAWSDLDRQFFEAAPPDDPDPPPDAPRFDDLLPTAAISAVRWTRRRLAVALASVCVVICLFAAVLALRSGDHPRSRVAPTAPATNAGAVKSPGGASTRALGAAYGS